MLDQASTMRVATSQPNKVDLGVVERGFGECNRADRL